jgi:hypothetical protein
MGQAAGQLEATAVADPLDGAMASGGGPPADGHADDLLSELAGAEIDRMLAAADVEPDPVIPPPPAVAPPVEIPPAVVAEVAVPAPVGPIETAKVETSKVEAAPEPGAPAPPPAATEPTSARVANADLAAVLAEAAADRKPSGELDLGTPIGGGRLTDWLTSLLVRPLALLNAPLEVLPDTVRDMVGKVAVVTLVNSIAVITYVVIFRHHR